MKVSIKLKRRPTPQQNLLFIDPGTVTLGYAVFTVYPAQHRATYITSNYIRIRAKRKTKDPYHWITRITAINEQLLEMIKDLPLKAPPIYKAFIELPSTYAGTKGTVASNTGSIAKLMGAVFAIKIYIETKVPAPTELIPVQKWKGQVPKHITQQRIKRHWNLSPKDHNEADAIGIGDWYIRKFLHLRPERCQS